MALKLTNNAVSRLAGSITSGQTTISVVPGEGVLFPVLGVGDWFPMTLAKSTGEFEIVHVTARTVDSMTVTRARESTAGIAFAAADRAELRLTGEAVDALKAWDELTGKPTFATVATTGAYSDLTGKPTISTVGGSGAYSDLTGKPTLAALAAKTTADYADLTPAAIASAANYRSNTASVLLGPNAVWEAAVPVVLTYGAALTLDFSTFINAKLTLTDNITLNTSNLKPGQAGTIEILQDATGSRTWAFTTAKFAYTGTAPVLPTTANSRVVVPYYIMSDSRVFLNMSLALVTP